MTRPVTRLRTISAAQARYPLALPRRSCGTPARRAHAHILGYLAPPLAGDQLAAKLERQTVLHDPGKRFCFLLTESAVRWQLCPPAVMALQVDRLVSLSRLPTVSIGVLPLDRSVPNGAYRTFVTYDRRLVTVELFSGQQVLRDPKDVEYYRALFDFFANRAVWADETQTMLCAIAGEFRSHK